MITFDSPDFKYIFRMLQRNLIEQLPVNVGEWQSKKLDDNPMTWMHELSPVHIAWPLPSDPDELAKQTGAHLPWAEDHFQERVGGEPLNPPPSNEWWPFAQKNNAAHKSEGEGEQFSHTYPERMWPKNAGGYGPHRDDQIRGIRFAYGDLGDVVDQLRRQRNTRQAYLPIWFPEDTGAVGGMRVPCTLGYHFMIRDRRLSISYYMRSCDLVRHFQDDVYMAGRLAQWVVHELNNPQDDEGVTRQLKQPLEVGSLHMSMANLHVFSGDTNMMKYRDSRGMAWTE